MLPGAALSTRCITMGAGHVMGKTTPVNMDNGPGIALMGITPFPKPLPRVLVCFRVRQGLFYKDLCLVGGFRTDYGSGMLLAGFQREV